MNEAGKREQQTEKDKIDLLIQKRAFLRALSVFSERNKRHILSPFEKQEGKKRRNKKENTRKEEGQ